MNGDSYVTSHCGLAALESDAQDQGEEGIDDARHANRMAASAGNAAQSSAENNLKLLEVKARIAEARAKEAEARAAPRRRATSFSPYRDQGSIFDTSNVVRLLPDFDEACADEYFLSFERTARLAGWPRDQSVGADCGARI